MSSDLFLLLWLNNLAGNSHFWGKLAIFFAANLLYFIFATIVLFAAFGFLKKFSLHKKKNLELFTFSAVSALVSRFGFAEIIRFFYNRPRPFESLENVRQLVDHASGNSFPSGHATMAFAAAAAAAFYYPKTSIWFFVAAFLVGLGRVAAGVHWPSDILAGALVGILSSWLMQFLKKKYWIKKPAN